MSILDVLARPRADTAKSAGSARPRLWVVPRSRPHAPRVPFVLLVLVVLGVGLVGLLLLNTQLQQGSFALHDLERTAAALEDQETALEQRVAGLEAPQSLAGKARDLGMVANPNPVFLRLADETVLGDPVPAEAPETPPIGPVEPPDDEPVAGDGDGDADGDDAEADNEADNEADTETDADSAEDDDSGDDDSGQD